MNPHQKASLILEKRRATSLEEQEKRIKEIYEKIPQIRQIDLMIKKIGFDGVNKAFNGKNSKENLKKIEELSNRKKEILQENGYSKDYMKKKPFCKICNDTGFVGTKICSCQKQIIIDERYNQSNLKNKLNKENFSNFKLNYYGKNIYQSEGISPYDNMLQVLEVVKKYVNGFSRQTIDLYIYGDVGRGKTFLVNSIAKELMDRNFSVLYQTSQRLLMFMHDYYYSFAEQKEKLYEKYDMIYNSDLLIIDDLGSENTAGLDNANLLDVINSRNIDEKPIIYSSNYSLEKIREIYGDRIFSRIRGNCLPIHIFGEDLRVR